MVDWNVMRLAYLKKNFEIIPFRRLFKLDSLPFFLFAYGKRKKAFKSLLKTSLNRIAVFGGDMRQVYLADILAEQGFEVRVYGLCKTCKNPGIQRTSSIKEVMEYAETVAAPVPFSKGLSLITEEALLKILKPGTRFFSGGIPIEFCTQAEKKEIQCVDYLKDEKVAMKNTLATAEGILAEAITRSPRNLFGSTCLVLGYGRCGSTLVSYLKGISSKVLVYERQEEVAARAYIKANRVIKKEELPEALHKADFIFNSIPAMALPRALLGYVRSDTLILDMASEPGGVDYKAAEELGITAVLLPGLPGKYAPASSAEILADKIKSKWKLEGE